MAALRRRMPGEVVLGVFQLCHPVPVLLHTVAVLLFALLAVWPHIVPGTLLLVVVVHVLMQVSIAVLNDYCDRRLDTLSKRDKPLVRGLVRPYEALVLGLLCILAMFVLLLFLPPLALLLSILYLLLGQAYNLGLKSTPLSGIVFALAIPLIPAYAFVGVGHPSPLLFWLVPVAALLGVTLNLGNSLPDLEADAAQHARTLAVVLGLRNILLLCPLFITLALLLTLLLAVTHIVSTVFFIFIPCLLITALLILFLLLLSRPVVKGWRRKQYFYLLVLTSLFFASGWLCSVLLVLH